MLQDYRQFCKLNITVVLHDNQLAIGSFIYFVATGM